MDLGRYLYFRGVLTREEFDSLSADQRVRGFCHPEELTNGGFHPTELSEIRNLDAIRELPFHTVLEDTRSREPRTCQKVEKRAGKTLNQLIDECYEWHRDQLEPICTYSPTAKYGRGLYSEQEEKKLVAQYLVAVKAIDGSTLIGDDEIVVLFEGSSCVYVGLAAAAARRDVTVITPNACLIREYRDNPAVGRRFESLCVVGGRADFETDERRCEHATVYGEICQQQLEAAVTRRPPVTVVVVSVSGLLPEAGPFVAGPTGVIKKDIITRALRQDEKVKKVVFVADYTKHLRSRQGSFGRAIFNPHDWRDLVEEYQNRIHVVTAPPPALRAALDAGQGHDVAHRDLRYITGPLEFTANDIEYNTVAVGLQKLLGGDVVHGQLQSRFSEAHASVARRAYLAQLAGTAQPSEPSPAAPVRLTPVTAKLRFTVDATKGALDEAAFRAALCEAVHGRGSDEAAYTMRTETGEKLTQVLVACAGSTAKAWQSVLEECQPHASDDMIVFARKTQTQLLEAEIGSQSYSVNFGDVLRDGFDEIIDQSLAMEPDTDS